MSFNSQTCNPLLSQCFFLLLSFFLTHLSSFLFPFTPRLRIWLISSLLPSNFLEFKLHFLFITGRKRDFFQTLLFSIMQRKDQYQENLSPSFETLLEKHIIQLFSQKLISLSRTTSQLYIFFKFLNIDLFLLNNTDLGKMSQKYAHYISLETI